MRQEDIYNPEGKMVVHPLPHTTFTSGRGEIVVFLRAVVSVLSAKWPNSQGSRHRLFCPFWLDLRGHFEHVIATKSG